MSTIERSKEDLVKVSNQNKLCFCAAILVLAATSFGHGQQGQVSKPKPAISDTCQSTFTFGSGQKLFNFCVSSHGNLVQFTSPEGFEHIREGAFSEGYGICDTTLSQSYFDYADGGDSGNWNDPVLIQPGGPNTFPLKITRITSNGAFTLTQSFSRNTGERTVKITMTIRNNGGILKEVGLTRFADIDANDADKGDFVNEFDFGADSAWGYNTDEYGLALSTVPTNVFHYALVWTSTSGNDPCNVLANIPTTPFVGDGSVALAYFFSLAAGQSKTLSVEYQRF
jgi:hypothetical protein